MNFIKLEFILHLLSIIIITLMYIPFQSSFRYQHAGINKAISLTVYHSSLRKSIDFNQSFNPQGKFNWLRSQEFWKTLLKTSNAQSELANEGNSDKHGVFPYFIAGDAKYGTSNLIDLHNAGHISGEYKSKDTRYSKTKTYALRFGYNGIKFHGYQSQKNISALTVEDVIHKVIQKTVIVAGRTDKGVSALSQVVSFSTPAENFPELIRIRFLQEKVCQDNDLVVYDCVRVPRKFNGNCVS